MTRTLKLSTGHSDQTNTFRVQTAPGRTSKCSLHRDYAKVNDGIYWGMSTGATVKSCYTDADRAEQVRLQQEEPVRHGDIVMIDGSTYRARVLGAYSDAVIFDGVL